MSRPRLLDLFCGAGGCSVGYARAGFDCVGIDDRSQPLRHYPYEHWQANALRVLGGEGPVDLDSFDVIHASPPCQPYSITSASNAVKHPDVLEPVVEVLTEWGHRTGRPWVIENVPGSEHLLPYSVMLCGSHFGLAAVDQFGREVRLRRHRLFASNLLLLAPGKCHCAADRAAGRIAGYYGGGSHSRASALVRRGGYTPDTATGKRLIGLDVPHRFLTQAIPPAYTEYLGEQLLAALPQLDSRST